MYQLSITIQGKLYYYKITCELIGVKKFKNINIDLVLKIWKIQIKYFKVTSLKNMCEIRLKNSIRIEKRWDKKWKCEN